MSEALRVSATAAGISYYPEHVARVLGFFEDEGLVVTTEAPGHGPWVTRAVLGGQADMALGGIWRPLMYRGRLDDFMSFALLCIRCPAVVISRQKRDGFVWHDMVAQKVIVPDGAPTPLIALLAVLRDHGIADGDLKLIPHFVGEEARELFLGGLGDFFVCSPPTSDEVVRKGAGYEVAELASPPGRLPWSLYYTTPRILEEKGDALGRFARGLQRGLDWVRQHDPEERPEIVERAYPKLQGDLAFTSIRACKRRGVWPDSVRMDADDLHRWQRILVDSHLIERPFTYREAFDARPSASAT